MSYQDDAVSTERVSRQVRNFEDPILRMYYHYVFGDRFPAANITNSSRILDVGCGAGRSLTSFDKFEVERVGVDLSLEAIRTAKERFAGHDASFAASDGTNLPFDDDSFDVVQVVGVLAGVDNIEPFIKECKRVLRPGGTLLYNLVNARTILPHKLSAAPAPNHLGPVLETTRSIGFNIRRVYPTFFISSAQKKLVFSERMPDVVRWVGLAVSIMINELLRHTPRVKDRCGLYWVVATLEE